MDEIQVGGDRLVRALRIAVDRDPIRGATSLPARPTSLPSPPSANRWPDVSPSCNFSSLTGRDRRPCPEHRNGWSAGRDRALVRRPGRESGTRRNFSG